MHPLALRSASSPPATATIPPIVSRHPVLVCGLLTATLDLGLAVSWWGGQGVAPARVLQAIAEWAIGPAAYAGGLGSAAFGAMLYCALMCVLASLYRGLSRRLPVLLRHPAACGALYGLAMYALVFGAIVPALIGRPAFGPPDWAIACALAYMFLIGMPCAWFASVPTGRRAG